MLRNKDRFACFLLLWIFVNSVKCQDIEEMSRTLDEILVGTRSFRRPRDHEDTSLIWQEYEFGTGVGNREEVVVTNISMRRYTDIPENVDWQFLQAENAYFIRADDLTLLFYKFNPDDLSIERSLNVTTEGRILRFKVLNLNSEGTGRENHANELIAVLLVKSQHGNFLYWYKIFGSAYTLYLTMPVQNRIQDIEFLQEGSQRELLLLDNDDTYLEGQSSINIYGFNVDDINYRIDIWFCRRLYLPKITDVQICPIYGSTVLAFREIDSVVLYESRNADILCQFEKFDVIESKKLANFVCFESGYIEYLAIAGREPRLSYFFENEFQDNAETDLHFNETVEIVSVAAIPLNTYREESLLLVQFNNSKMSALTWQGSKFKGVLLPNEIMGDFDLSKIVVVPRVGFVHGNALVRIEVILRESAHSTHDETESMLKTRALLEEVFRKQEAVFDETEARLDHSYLKNPVVTGAWNLSAVDVANVTIEKDVRYGAVRVGTVDLNVEDVSTNVTSSLRKLEKLEASLDQVLPNLEDIANANSTKIILSSDVETIGDFLVNGTLHAGNVTAALINDESTSTAARDTVDYLVDVVIDGRKSFPSIDTENLTVLSLNGIPLEEIVFDTSIKNYRDVDFSKLKRLEIEGHLSFFVINDVNWTSLMQNVVWKDQPAIIPGEIFVEGLIAEEVDVKNLNQLRYPDDYVLTNVRSLVNVMGEKYFSNLSVTHLLHIKEINGIDIDDFVILNRHEVIDKEITFENLEIDGPSQLDGDVTGINISNIVEDSLRETNNLTSDVIFENLIVMGNIVVQDSIDTKTWSDFEDLLLKTEQNARITGNKKFLSGVLMPKVAIQSGKINDHALTEFVTLESDQQFPYLKKISANVTFGNVSYGATKKLEDYITREQSTSGCLKKVLFFIKPPIVDNLTFDTVDHIIPGIVFLNKLNRTLQRMHFEDLTLSTLTADEISPNTINGRSYADLIGNALTASTRQNVTGSLTIDNLETVLLDAEFVNGMPIGELNRWLTYATALHDDIFYRNVSIESLQTTGTITVSSINEHDIVDIFKEDNMGSVIFNESVSIENLTVMGLVNGWNLLELAADAVRKTDRDVTFTGRKTFENVTCGFLEARSINGHSVDDILDPERQQLLKGPVVVNGSVTVLNAFNTTGKIKNLFFKDLTDRFTPLGNNSYVLRGNFYFTESASVAKLDVDGPIRESTFDSFLRRTISKSDANVTVSGAKSFLSPIAFHGAFVIDGSLNDIDLHRFHEKAVYIDKPFSIDSKVVFKENVHIGKNLHVKMKLQANTIVGVDMVDLQNNAIARNKPTYIPARMTLDNVTFQAGVRVAQVNDLPMDQLISLRTNQFIEAESLNCTNVTFKNMELSGRVNNHVLDDIYANTFMIYGNQNVTGNIKIRGNVYAYHDFNAHSINDFNPKQIVSVNTNDTLTGNFMFKDPIVLDNSLRILGLLNDVRPINWQGMAVKTTGDVKQIISGKWRVHGNVYFEENVDGSELLSGVNVTEISANLAKEHVEIDRIVEHANETLNNVCKDLNALKCNTVNQIYKFNTFDYHKILEFDEEIHEIRNIELGDLNYFLVNHGICNMTLLLHGPSTSFDVVDEIFDFGLIDRWIFFKSNRTIYLFTIAKRSCGRNLNNVWKLENDRLTHVLELGNASDVMNLNRDSLLGMIHENPETVPEDTQSNILEAFVSHKDEKLNSILNSNAITSANRSLIDGLQGRSSNDINLRNCVGCSSVLNFKVGIFEREEYIYYDEEISQGYIYLCKHDISQTKILQIIKAHRPKSFTVLNFDGFVETLLIFVENDETIQIYEYRGIEGFVYRNAINIKVDKLYNFKVRKYTNLKKIPFLAAIRGSQLTILEAKMYGEKLDLETLDTDSCYMDTCSVH